MVATNYFGSFLDAVNDKPAGDANGVLEYLARNYQKRLVSMSELATGGGGSLDGLLQTISQLTSLKLVDNSADGQIALSEEGFAMAMKLGLVTGR